MANIFNIKVTATDNATKTVNKINKSVAQIFRPYDEAKKRTGSFFNALGKNDLFARPIAGMQKFGGALGSLGTTFGVAENSIVSSSGRIAASIGGMGGPIGGFVAGGIAVAGAATAIAVKMGNLGLDVSRVAKNLGVTTRQLQEYRGAAQLAGLSTESMDAGLGSLATTLQDAGAGRNMQAATLLSQMHIDVKRTKDGAVDTVAALRDIADVVSKIKDPNIARKMTDMLGVTELLPMLREGKDAIDAYIVNARKAGMVQSAELIESNEQQAKSWLKIKSATEGLGVSLGNLIGQYARLDSMSKWIDSLSGPLQRWSADKAGQKAKTDLMNQGKFVTGNKDVNTTAFMQQFRVNSDAGFYAALSGLNGGNVAGASGGARGLRNNNPGNLRSWPGAGSAGGFAQFASPADGLSAMAKNVIAYQDKYKISTIEGLVKRWAPASDGNDEGAYVSALSKQTGFGGKQNLNFHDPGVLAPLISGITKHENGSNPYSAEAIGQAVASAIKESGGAAGSDKPITVIVQGLPAGTTVKAVRGLGQPTVGQTMLPGGQS